MALQAERIILYKILTTQCLLILILYFLVLINSEYVAISLLLGSACYGLPHAVAGYHFLRACSKSASSSLSQKRRVFEYRSAAYIKIGEQRNAEKLPFLAKIADFEQTLRTSSLCNARRIVKIFYRSEIVKLLLIGLLSAGVFRFIPIQAPAFFIGIIVAPLSFWVSSGLWLRKKVKVKYELST